eukprot:CAMPEP_0117054680 /NCGR_PEP_ID=MMETSP0472-20121206/37897_1 /TAXON_ID=693140 ORGANISM="Tiarina fusus, Strain LIS" /NCGR_SAMPLE_ID=MMETSP0472 /ASSEMBLY_ACC=CAM_ASM_000603 /LENGTH=89 /DNA_ID=CAMNT_0004770365 /DNA_START=123 /DNA_END=392 /DNA_ORIENTATION=-
MSPTNHWMIAVSKAKLSHRKASSWYYYFGTDQTSLVLQQFEIQKGFPGKEMNLDHSNSFHLMDNSYLVSTIPGIPSNKNESSIFGSCGV